GDRRVVEVEELDRHILVGVRPAEERVALLLLVVGQRERRVLLELDVLAVEHEGLAGRALPLLAAVHEHDALLERGAQDRLVLVDLDLDADRFEPHYMLVGHGPSQVSRCSPPCASRSVGSSVGRKKEGRGPWPPALLPYRVVVLLLARPALTRRPGSGRRGRRGCTWRGTPRGLLGTSR